MRRFAYAILVCALAGAPAAAQDSQPRGRSHAVLYGTLIGTAAGVAGGALFFGLTNCHYGSDSSSAMIACGAVTGGIIAAGIIAGHKIGHQVEKRGRAPDHHDATRKSSALVVSRSVSVRLRAPTAGFVPAVTGLFTGRGVGDEGQASCICCPAVPVTPRAAPENAFHVSGQLLDRR